MDDREKRPDYMGCRQASESILESIVWRLKERPGIYGHLRITVDFLGLHVYNTEKKAEIILWRHPAMLYGRLYYGSLSFNDRRPVSYIEHPQYLYVIQKIFDETGRGGRDLS